jgi:putative acetyltransferase
VTHVIVRAQHSDEWPAVRRLLTEAFADDGTVATLAEALNARGDRAVDSALVAESDGELIGHVQLSRAWIDAKPALVEVLVLSPLGVAPLHQRRGIGRALCDSAVERGRQLNAPAIFLEGDPAYYGRLGWQRASDRGFTAPSARIPNAGFQVIVLPSWQPWMIGAVVYNDTFWTLDCVGLRPAP